MGLDVYVSTVSDLLRLPQSNPQQGPAVLALLTADVNIEGMTDLMQL